MNQLSLCMIVKNEEKWMAQCLRSVQGLVHEMIIVDTGSTDSTSEIARSMGAVVYHHPWEDDFSKARNFSLSHATKDWILVLDADEVIALGDHARIRHLIEAPDVFLYFLVQTTYAEESASFGWVANLLKEPEGQGYAGYIESPLVRLFRNIPEIRFQGRIHEHAVHADPKIQPQSVNLRIHHYGKIQSVKVQQNKNELYLKLGLRKCQERPNDAHAWYELGVQYWNMEREKEAEEALRKSIKIAPAYIRPKVGLAIIASKRKNYSEVIQLYSDILKLEPANPLPYLYLPAALIEMQNYRLAEEVLEAGKGHVSNHPSFHINRGVVRQANGNLRGSISCFKEALKLNPQEPLAFFNLGVSHMELMEWDASREALEKAIRFPSIRQMSKKRLAEWHFRQHLFPEACMILKEVLEEDPQDEQNLLNLGIVLIQSGELLEARHLFQRIHSSDQFSLEDLERLKRCSLAVDDLLFSHQVEEWIHQKNSSQIVKQKGPHNELSTNTQR